MAAFPTTVATDSDLYIAVNATSTQLTDNPLSNSATTVNVTDATAFPTVGFISIDSEIIKYTGKTGTSFTGCTRGADGTTAVSHVQNSQVFHNVIAAHHNTLKDDLIATEQFISDLIGRTNTQIKAPNGSVSAPTYSYASDTDTGIFRATENVLAFALGGTQYFKLETTGLEVSTSTWQIKGADGTVSAPSFSFANDPDTGIYRSAANTLRIATNGVLTAVFSATEWSFQNAGTTTFEYDSANGVIGFRKSMVPSANNSFDIGTSSFKLRDLYLVGLVGTTTNDNAPTGRVGEYAESVITTFTNFPTTATYGDLTSISLTAGDWDISLTGSSELNGATITVWLMGVSTTTGNSATGLVEGNNRLSGANPTASIDSSMSIPNVRFSLSATTTIYFKYYAEYSAGNPRFKGRISARRVR